MNETIWVYVKSESNLFTVGFYDPLGKWHAESDHESAESAAERVHYLNGGKQVQKEGVIAKSTHPLDEAFGKTQGVKVLGSYPNSCNRHGNCDKADEVVRAKGGFAASHCHDDCCEDCFGS